MGKAKKRNFHKSINADKSNPLAALSATFTREDAIEKAIKAIKSNNCGNETKDIITLFGITAEELAEAINRNSRKRAWEVLLHGLYGAGIGAFLTLIFCRK